MICKLLYPCAGNRHQFNEILWSSVEHGSGSKVEEVFAEKLK